MNSLIATFAPSFIEPRALPARTVAFAAAALRGLDIAALTLAGCLAFAVARPSVAFGLGSEYGRDLLIAAFFLPFVMDQVGGYRPDRLHRLGHLLRSAALGGAILFGALLATGLAVDAVSPPVGAWLAAWLLASIAVMTAARAAFWMVSQRRVADGRLRDSVAIVGTDTETLRLAGALGRQRGRPLDIVGVFRTDSSPADMRFTGTLDDLVELGKTRRIDKVIVAAAPAGHQQTDRVVHALKALAVDILLAPRGSGGEQIVRSVDRVGGVAVIRTAKPRPALAPADTASAA
jgi:FlaA1/EpsC-like NDP-sugar epimerase